MLTPGERDVVFKLELIFREELRKTGRCTKTSGVRIDRENVGNLLCAGRNKVRRPAYVTNLELVQSRR